jgi:putative SOS response-associated peptidase YedK
MPVILDTNTCWQWIEGRDLSILQAMLRPFPAGQMESLAVERMPKDPV